MKTRRVEFARLKDFREKGDALGRNPYVDRSEVPGAWPNGTRVSKCNDEPTDAHKEGDAATVIGSMGPDPEGGFGYFVEWDDTPGVPCFIAGRRLERFNDNV